MQRLCRLTLRSLRTDQPARLLRDVSVKTTGPFATVGMAEDTWALNESVLDEDTFLAQVESIKQERERMFFSALDRTRRGLVACVFDTTDRVQHMFYRYLDERSQGPHAGVIERLYCDMDRLVGETLKYVDDENGRVRAYQTRFLLIPAWCEPEYWLKQNGYLALQTAHPKAESTSKAWTGAAPGVRNGTGRTLPEPDRPRIGRNGIRVRSSGFETGTRV